MTYFEKTKNHYLATNFLVYLLVGGLSNGMDIGLYWVMTSLGGLHYLVSHVVSTSAGLAINFSLHKMATFKSKAGLKRQISRYVGLVVFNYMFGVLLLSLLVETLGMHYLVAKVLTLGAIVTYNFLALKILVFS